MILKIEKKLSELCALRRFKPSPTSRKKCLESKRFIINGATFRLIRFSKRVWLSETDGTFQPNFIVKKSQLMGIYMALENGYFKFI